MCRGLARVLSKAGICSRTVAAEWIRAGRVRVDGALVRDPERRIVPERAVVTLDGRRIGAVAHAYWALHKPRGFVTTRSDPAGRRTVYDLVGEIAAWAIAVGRLDRDTSGLLLFTNDTQFAERVTNPTSHVPKTYRATVKPRLPDAALEKLRAGVVLSDGPTRPARVARIGDRGPTTVLELTISEGRNRQVRRMIREVGGKVVTLVRVSIGPVELGDLAAGAVRELTAREVRALLRAGSEER
ncbi:MAG TPA: pseudouridine synthase [Planctomycetota bacterium]|jgi:pseudouridine synthase|nr:pseudouridine synthase [Planctomycetota bacterium]